MNDELHTASAGGEACAYSAADGLVGTANVATKEDTAAGGGETVSSHGEDVGS